jgi:putative CocE/NonD family hydrolase
MRWSLVAVASLFVAGCFGGSPGNPDDRDEAVADPRLELLNAEFNTDGPTSFVLNPGPHEVLPVDDVRFPTFDGTELASAVWRPDTDEKVPVILMISPYFGTGLYSPLAFYLENFVPHGYAFAKVAIRGTSFSDGCMESMGESEQRDIDEVVSFFGQQPWSNGNVTIIGVSYVGTTPWAAATFGNPHLKAIVPISGVTSWFELGFRNGTAEPRTPIHMPLYWAQYGTANEVTEALTESDVQDLLDNACTAPAEGLVASQYAIATGEMGPFADYWMARDLRQRVLDNYEGAVFVVHGIRDWNVNADMAFPFATQLAAKGNEVKILLGQWQHSSPDVVGRIQHVRYDYAEILLRYWDRHLKGLDRYSGPPADVEDNLGLWRAEEAWPPHDVDWTRLELGTGVLSPDPTPTGGVRLVNPAGVLDGPDCSGQGIDLDQDVTAAWFSLGARDTELRFAGQPQLHVTAVPSDVRGGELQAELYHFADGELVSRVAHAVMDLKFYAGGHEAQSLTPGQAVVARMEFYPTDVAIPAGDELRLRIVPDANIDPCTQAFRSGTEDSIQGAYLPGQSPAPVEIRWGAGSSVLKLPVIVRDVGEGKYPGQPD